MSAALHGQALACARALPPPRELGLRLAQVVLDFGFGRIAPDDGGETFDWADDGGLPVLTLPARAGPLCDDPAIDILAWQPAAPQRWWVRTGHADVLGAGALDGDVVRLYPTPWDWLSAAAGALARRWMQARDSACGRHADVAQHVAAWPARHGVCVLHPREADWLALLGDARRVVCASPAYGDWVKARLKEQRRAWLGRMPAFEVRA